jgi:hypothetical protein
MIELKDVMTEEEMISYLVENDYPIITCPDEIDIEEVVECTLVLGYEKSINKMNEIVFKRL